MGPPSEQSKLSSVQWMGPALLKGRLPACPTRKYMGEDRHGNCSEGQLAGSGLDPQHCQVKMKIVIFSQQCDNILWSPCIAHAILIYYVVSCILVLINNFRNTLLQVPVWEDECPHSLKMIAVCVLVTAWLVIAPAGLVLPRPPSSCSSLQQLLASLQTAVTATEDLCHAAELTGG